MFDLVREAESTHDLSGPQKVQALLIRKGIWRAVDAASFRPDLWEAFKDWYSGAGIETAWSELHRAAERMLLVQSAGSVQDRIADIDVALRSNLKEDDPRLTPATNRLGELGKANSAELDDGVREELRHYQQLANAAGDQAHANVRSQRNLLIAIGFCVSLGLALIAVLHALAPSFINLSGPTSATDASRAATIEVWEAESVGALGGLIAAVFTISRLGGFAGPYRLPVYQALIRVPAGAAVALAAVLLVQSDQIKALGAQSGLGILAVALLFGYAPDVLLRFMDQKATSLLGQAQSKNNPARPPLAQPRA